MINSYAMEIHASTYVIEVLKIKKFDSRNPIHLKLSQLSKKAHEIARKIYEENREDLKENLKDIEDEIDRHVAELYGISDEELRAIKNCLKIFREGETEEEETEEEAALPKAEEIKLMLEPLFVDEDLSKEAKIGITNNLAGDIENAEVMVVLGSEKLLEQKIGEIRKDETKVLEFVLPRLKEGQYKLRITFIYEINGKKARMIEEKTLFVKSRKRDVAARTNFDDELDSLLREM